MTPAQRDEGRRLLEYAKLSDSDDIIDRWYVVREFLLDHADSILADAPDTEAIAREAVIEFAEDLSNRLLIEARETNNFDTVRGISVSKKIVDELAVERGVELKTATK